MRKVFRKVVALAVAAAMMIPAMGISASAAIEERKLDLADRLAIRAVGSGTVVGDAWSGSGQAKINDDTTSKEVDLSNLYDGDPTTLYNLGKLRIAVIDISDVDVTQVKVYNRTNGALAVATLDEITQGEVHTFAAGKRLNTGATTDNDGNTIYTVTDEAVLSGNYLVIINNKSGAASDIGEVEVYANVEVTNYNLTIDGETYNAEYNSKISLTASAKKDGQVFSHWVKNGQIISYAQEYIFYACEDATVEAVYADEKPDVLGCAYYVGKLVGNNYEIMLEWSFPSLGRVIVAPTVTDAEGNAVTLAKVDVRDLPAGTHQYKVTLGGVDKFDAANFTESRIKVEGIYYDDAGTKHNPWNGYNFFFAGIEASSGSNRLIGNPAEATEKVVVARTY